MRLLKGGAGFWSLVGRRGWLHRAGAALFYLFCCQGPEVRQKTGRPL